MELFTVLQNRHSYRGGFSNEKVKRENLLEIVRAGAMAPSGKNCQTTHFIIVDDPTLLSQISSLQGANQAIKEAKAMIICCIDKEPTAIYEGYNFQIEDCAAAVQNMLLAITDFGYASVWVDGWIRVQNRATTIAQLLSVPKDKVVRILLPIGIPNQPVTAPEKMDYMQRTGINKY